MSIQKRTYKRTVRGGKVTQRTAYKVRWLDTDGKHRSRQFDTYRDAQAFEGQTKAGYSLPIAGRNAKLVTLTDFWNEWLPLYRPEAAPATVEGHEAVWKAHIEPVLGDRPLSDFLSSLPMSQLFAAMQAKGVGSGSVRRSIMLVKMVLDKAVEWNLLPYNGTRTYILGRKASAKRKRPLVMVSAVKIEAMRSALLMRRAHGQGLTPDQHNRKTVAMLTLLAYAGLRPAEALALTWGDLSELHQELLAGNRVANGERTEPKTPTSIRRIPIVSPLLEDLLAWRAVTPYRQKHQPIIPNSTGGAWNTQALRNWARLIFQPMATTQGLPSIRPYDLRHTWCMSHIKCGMDLVRLAELAGSSAETIAKYYLAQPGLQRDLEIPDRTKDGKMPDFAEWVQSVRRSQTFQLANAHTA